MTKYRVTFLKKWQGRNLIKEIRAEQEAERKARPDYRKLTVKHNTK